MKFKTSLFVFLLGAFQSLFSQHYNSKKITADQGLPDTYVYSINQTKTGFLWVSTSNELVYFDGQLFSKIKSDTSKNDFVFSSVTDNEDNLWLGTFTGKLFKISANTFKSEEIKNKAEGTINKMIASKKQHALYLLSVGNWIYTYKNKVLQKIKETENYQINDFIELNNGALLLATSEGISMLDVLTEKIISLQKTSGFIKQIQAIKNENGGFLYYQEGKGIFKFKIDVTNNSIIELENIFAETKDIEINTFFFDETNSSLFIGTKDERLIINDFLNKQNIVVGSDDFSGNITSFFKDNESNIWIGTSGKGLFRFLRTDYDVFSINNESVYSICQDLNGLCYYGTKSGLIVCKNYNQEIKRIEKIGGLKLGKVTSLYFDSKNLWIGLENNGLKIIDINTLKEVQINFSKIENITVNSISYDNFDHQIQVNTNLDGVYVYEDLDLKHHFDVQNSLLHNNVYHSIKNENGKTYYATHNTAFNFSTRDSIYELALKDQQLITDFNCFANLSKGNIAIATSGDGLYFLNDSSVTPFALNKQFNSKFCNGIVKDKIGNLWISQQYDLYQYHTKENILKRINFSNSGQLIFNPNAIFQNSKGDLFFGTNGQVIVFRNEYLNSKSPLPIPRIIKTFINDSLYDVKDGFHLEHGQFNFHFEFSALSLKNSEEVKFSYLLEGRDIQWSEPSASRRAFFSNLSDGDYTFKVMAFNSDGFESKEIASFNFHIDRPFWKNPVFWIFILIALITAVIVFVQIRTAALVKTNLRLEKMVQEKTSELQEEKLIVENKNKLIEEQNEEIKSSIHYAKRIQDAILPDKKIIIDRREKIFIHYQPRDIVSGDFYWLTEIGDLKIIVVADCTGHGVPGAFMSMIGNTLLNKIILERHIHKPCDILFALDNEIRSILKQHHSDATRDGMDMAICALNRVNNQLSYSGAMRPLFFIRDEVLTEYDAAKHAIGGYNYGESREFMQHEIEGQKGDMFYIFSDGYADQFGGPKGKKFMLKNFKQLLATISNKELKEQEDIIKQAYNDWKGELEQVDDVCVIGVKI